MIPPSSHLLIDPQVPQVLLFGHSGAGKSALLGALFQASEHPGNMMLGELQDYSGRLAEIRDSLYRGSELERTHTELISYAVRIRPWSESGVPMDGPMTLILHDCSGKAAESLIRRPAALFSQEATAPIARAVIQADAILFLVNAAADDAELAAAFEEFRTFLSVVARGKEIAREVGGFPIFLVLTQCDRLARPEDTLASWQARMHARAESAWHQFSDFLKDAAHEGDEDWEGEQEDASPFLAFGSMDPMVATVSIRQPLLTDAPGQPTTPYHVDELFRDCFAAAIEHRARVRRSNRRLKWTVRTSLLFVCALLLGSIGMVIFSPAQQEQQLADRVMAYETHEPPAAVRLAEPYRERNLRVLTEFRDDPLFNGLPGDLQSFVESRLQEIRDYQHYRDLLLAATAPADTRSLEELAVVEKSLNGPLDLPHDYSWEETPAGKLRQKWLADVRAIRKAETQLQDRYRDLIRRGLALSLTSSFGGNWRSDVGLLLAESARPLVALNEPLPGSEPLPRQRGEAVTYRVPYEFDRVYQARQDWLGTRDRLTHLRDLTDALGLSQGADRPPALLLLPEPGPGVNLGTLPSTRWTALQRQYLTSSNDFRDWTLQHFPDPARSILAARLDHEFKVGVSDVQALLRERMGPGHELQNTPQGWRLLAGLLTNATSPFPEWGRLLHLYGRLRDPSAQNPVLELAAFLKKSSFDLTFNEIELTIPIDLSLDPVRPSGPLTITVKPREGSPRTIQLKQQGEGVRTGSNVNYRLVAEGVRTLEYSPGDQLSAELLVRAGLQDSKLVWDAPPHVVYQFELFSRDARLVKSGGTSEPAIGVKLAPTTGTHLPRIPVLLPDLVR